MTKSDNEIHQECVDRFVDLANTLKDEGIDIKVVSHGLMSASCVYTTYTVSGNEGGLTQSGVEKVTDVYKRELGRIQRIKKDNEEESMARAAKPGAD
jgi:hypothetical protein